MGWARFDDQRALNKKLRRAAAMPEAGTKRNFGFGPRGLDECAICHCANVETDGFLSDLDLEMLAAAHSTPMKQVWPLVTALIEVGRWERDNKRHGHWIHDFLDFNPSHGEQETRRARDRQRQAKSRGRHDRSETGQFTLAVGADTNGGHGERHSVTPSGPDEMSHRTRPVPSRPDSPPSGSSQPAVDETGDGRTDDLVEAAFRILAERRAAVGVKPIANRPRWLEATIGGLRREYPDAVDQAETHGLTTAEQLADWLEPRRPAPKLDPLEQTAAAARARAARSDQPHCETCGAQGGGGWIEKDGRAEHCPDCNPTPAVTE